MIRARDGGVCEDQCDVNELGNPFMLPSCGQLSEEEITLRNDLKHFKQAQKLLNDLREELASKRVQSEVPVKLPRNTDKAKEEAMKLLKSGAISFDTSNERHVFKRKIKESEGTESEETLDSIKSKKTKLYDNFVSSDCISPFRSPSHRQVSTPFTDIRRDLGRKPSFSRHHSQSVLEGEARRRQISTLYVSFNGINEALIREIFEPYGPILNIRIDDKRGYGFVTLKSHEMAEKSLQLDRTLFNNIRLRVNYARRQHYVRDNNIDDENDYSNPRNILSGGSHFNQSQRAFESKTSPARGDGGLSSSPSATSNRNLINYSDVDT